MCNNRSMATKLPELAVILAIITLGQRFSGYENHPLGYLLVAVGILALLIWLYSVFKHYSNKDDVPKQHAGKLRIGGTWLAAAILVGFIAYPWIAARNTPPIPKPAPTPSQICSLSPTVTAPAEPSTATKHQQDTFRHELIQAWRAMISEIAAACPVDQFSESQVSAAIQRHPVFQTLRPYLSEEAGGQLARTTHVYYGAKIQNVLITLEKDVDRIEQGWRSSAASKQATQTPKATQPSQPKENSSTTTAEATRDNAPITVQPGAAASFGQQGGITAATVNVTPIPPMPELTYVQRVTMDKALKDAGPHTIAVRFTQGSERSQYVADQFKELIKGAGWTLRRPKFLIEESIARGIFILVDADEVGVLPETATVLRSALTAAGLAPGAVIPVQELGKGSVDLAIGVQ